MTTSTGKDRYMTVLIFLFGLYSTAFFALIDLAKKSAITDKATKITLVGGLEALLLLVIALIIGINWLLVLISAILELKSILDARHANGDALIEYLRKEVLNSPANMIAGNMALIVILFLSFVWYLAWWLSLLLLIFYIIVYTVSWRTARSNKDSLQIFFKEQLSGGSKLTCKSAIALLFIVFVLALTVFLAINSITHSSVDFITEFDKSEYFIGDNVYLKIYPSGILKPEIVNITYSNEHLPVNYVQHPQYTRSPVYVVISGEMLKDEPYNSYLTINYRVPTLIPLYDYLSTSEFIPVFRNFTKFVNMSINTTNNISINLKSNITIISSNQSLIQSNSSSNISQKNVSIIEVKNG